MKLVKLKTINLKNNPQLNERWLQNIIAEDPSILGIGDVFIKDKERIHVGSGRLDLLLQDTDGHGRYEVEIQLGATDESHIIRTIEYWDIERKKYPQYDHTAVIVAEDITSRFLNVVGLFNGFIPIMVIQVTAIETAEGIGLQFTKVLDTVKLGYLDEDEETAEPTDRNFWETTRGTKKTVALADRIQNIAKTFAPTAELSYNKHYSMNKESVIQLVGGGSPKKCAKLLGYKNSQQVYHWENEFKPIVRASILRRMRFAGIEYPAEWEN